MPVRNSQEEEPFIQLHDITSAVENTNVANSRTLSGNIPTLIHCHDLRPVTSNKKAWRKLVIASTLCFIFAIGEVVGKY